MKVYKDNSAYALAKREGKTTKEYFGMHLTLLFAIPAIVYFGSNLLQASAEPMYQLGVIVLVCVVFYKLMNWCDDKY